MAAAVTVQVARLASGFRVQLVAVVSALLLDLLVLTSMVSRIGELGFTFNRTAALGLNLVLVVNLAGVVVLPPLFDFA